jgi:CheY-like chemotaxis protein
LLRGVSIVVVDDHQDARESVAAILERDGATVLIAGCAREAIRLVITNCSSVPRQRHRDAG